MSHMNLVNLLREENAELKNEIDKLKKNNCKNEIQVEIAKKNHEIDKLRKENTKLKQRVGSLENESSEVVHDVLFVPVLPDKRAEKTKLQQRVASLENESSEVHDFVEHALSQKPKQLYA